MKKVLEYFNVHQSKMVHAFIVKFSMTEAFFVYAGKLHAVLDSGINFVLTCTC